MLVSIPHPQRVEPATGTLSFGRITLIFLPPESHEHDYAAASLLQEEIRRLEGRLVPISRAWRPATTEGVIAIGDPMALAEAFDSNLPGMPALANDPEAYAMVIDEACAFLVANTPRGRLWAVQTLRQLIRLYGTAVPCLHISDAPAMRYRGVLLDVARRKVPTLETLKNLVDTLSLLKLNMLQLQVEHTFQWQRHPKIGFRCGSLSCEDITELDAHCRQRGVELVPMLQSFGHMRNILMLDEYRQLSENPELQWSLCATDPASIAFMDELYEEFLPCFSSGLVNIGCDETIDLGRKGGRSNDIIAAVGKGRVYVNYIKSLYDLLSVKYGKQVMMWGDVVLHYPELVPELPQDLIMLNWWYEPKERFEQVDVFANSGLPQIVCPGTSSWNAIFPRLNAAWTNVDHFVRDGKAVGALGMLNTDWGDGGHYNLLGNSFFSYAQGAEVSWAAEPMPRATFETILGPALFGAEGETIVGAIRDLGAVVDNPDLTQPNCSQTATMLFSLPCEEAGGGLRHIPAEALNALVLTAVEASNTLHHAIEGTLERSAVADLAWAADALSYAARKTLFGQQVLALAELGTGDVPALLATGEELLAEHEATVGAFRERWLAGNRHSEMGVALSRLDHAKDVLKAIQTWLASHPADGQPHALPALPSYQTLWKEDTASLWTAEVMEEHLSGLA